MAPARMISFIEQHVAHCEVCQADPVIHDEIVKITEIILPESKIPKAMRLSADAEEDDEELDIEEDELPEDSEVEDKDLEDIEDIDEEPMLDDDEEI